MNERTDEVQLAEFAKTGSQSAFRAIALRHGPLVYSACLRHLGRTHLAEDAAHGFALMGEQRGRRFINPITLAVVMLVQPNLIIPGWQRLFRVFRGLLDGLAGQIHEDFPLAPTYVFDPLR